VVNQLSDTMRDKELTGDVVRTWQKHWGRDKTLCFALIGHMLRRCRNGFTEAGVSCAYQDANTGRE